jgi:hypothetical protein
MEIDHMVQRTQELTYAASAAVSGFGVWTWLADNATAIGALCMLGGLTLGIATFGINWFYRHKASKRNKE